MQHECNKNAHRPNTRAPSTRAPSTPATNIGKSVPPLTKTLINTRWGPTQVKSSWEIDVDMEIIMRGKNIFKQPYI